MSKSANFKASIARKYLMALTGLFLCTFLIGHLLGNLQLIFHTGEEGRKAFNEYAYFMQHNLFIKTLSYVTYASVLIHVIVAIVLTIRNKKARPQDYAYNKPSANSSSASRNMGILGTAILIFLVTHMANFWAKMHWGGLDLHTVTKQVDIPVGRDQQTGETLIVKDMTYLLTTKGEYKEYKFLNPLNGGQEEEIVNIKDETFLYDKKTNLQVGEVYKDLHSNVFAFFGQERNGKVNDYAMWATILYVLSMVVLAFHLWHGFGSAFQSLGLNHKRYNGLIKVVGQAFAIIVPLLFAIIPVMIFMGTVN